MNTLERDDFGEFFAELHDGARPFAWQWRLLDAVIAGHWPDALVAPTGAGKTSVIDVHVFALAAAHTAGTPVPRRRLAMVVDRRVLVDDQYDYATRLADRLECPDQSQILAAVADALWEVQGPSGRSSADDADAARSPLLVARLRGGEPPSTRWADHPTAAAVICATPEMWGSRLLFRGYGSSARAWPREAGLFAFDTVAVVDEAHLSRQLVHTARRVSELAVVADQPWEGPQPLHVVEATATPDTAGENWLGVDGDDLTDNAVLADRLRKPKPVTVVECKGWPTHQADSRVTGEIVRCVLELVDASSAAAESSGDLAARTIGCFVNSVDRAVSVAAALRDLSSQGRPLTVVMVCGQVRPIDIDLLRKHHDGVLTPNGNRSVDVIVSTQSLEVGVDIDLAGIVTELASGSALAQRAGRVNRRGLRPDGPVVVIGPDGPVRPDTFSGPYGTEELNQARDWIIRRHNDTDGLAPWALRTDPPPSARPRRTLWQRPELGQVWHWARTSDDLAADPELDLWLSDDLEPETSVGIVVRDDLPDDSAAIELISLLPPRRHETFSVPLRTARKALVEALRRDGDDQTLRHTVVVRGSDVVPLDWTIRDGDREPRLRPGDVVVIDSATALFTQSKRDGYDTPPAITTDPAKAFPARDRLEAIAEIRGPKPGEVVHRVRLNTESTRDLAEWLRMESLVPGTPEGHREVDVASLERDVVGKWLDSHARPGMERAAADLLLSGEHKVDVIVLRDDDTPAQVLVIDGRRAVADEYVRQEWSPSARRVLLSAHQRAVAERVTELCEILSTPAELTEVLRLAAAHHDDGKADKRFQIRLGARASDQPLAKSRVALTPAASQRRRDLSGLPSGWRHEQRSVVDAWETIPDTVDRDLVARLIGTSHGHGRTGFPHVAGELMPDGAAAHVRACAEDLFDRGRWDQLIEGTDLRYGVWACAYLEALVRAADGRISAEGK
ncbi:MAG: type I-U CRISPR-associated helicase/endonuclease Cas3 [Nocardia sp.]|nr:type I-U CRISPR-associated helicase/endonuclease Cas3 [Nocardia sp.]